MTHDANPAELVHNVQGAITKFALVAGDLRFGTLGELKVAAEALHLAARSLYLATQISPETEIPTAPYNEMPSEAEVPAADLDAMFATPSEPHAVILRTEGRPLEDNGTYAAVAGRIDGQRAVATPGGMNGAYEVDISVQLAYALQQLDAFDTDRELRR